MSSATGMASITAFAVGKARPVERLWERFQSIDDERLNELFIDSTIVRGPTNMRPERQKKRRDKRPRLWVALGVD